jgi:hypothetical protein
MAYQQLLEDCMDTPPGYRKDPVVVRDIDPKKWLGRYQNQIEDLDLLLDDGVHVVYEDSKVFIKYKDQITFRIEHLKKLTPPVNEDNPDLLELDIQYENNIYVDSVKRNTSDLTEPEISELPVYTEKANTEESKVLGNFWISFVEHGLAQVLDSFSIKND